MQVTITRKSRNLGIAATASPDNGPHGWYFAPLGKPEYVGGCATIRRAVAEYHRIWSRGTYYRTDLFVGGKRVAHDDGSYENLMSFCRDTPESFGRYLYDIESVTVTLDDEEGTIR